MDVDKLVAKANVAVKNTSEMGIAMTTTITADVIGTAVTVVVQTDINTATSVNA